MKRPPLELDAVRSRLSAAGGRAYWRSLEELAQTPEFAELLQREFPRQASEWDGAVDRRAFLSLMAASLALAGVGGCTNQPPENILPYVRSPERIVPGEALHFATAADTGPGVLGLLAKSHMGRPTKLEGNELHPASLGATDAFAQASILSLYDPDRSQTVMHLAEISTWEAFLEALRGALRLQEERQGAGLRILTGTVRSPTLARQLRLLLERYPQARWHQYQPVNDDYRLLASRLAFGRAVSTVYRFDQARVVLSLDADFLAVESGSVRYARDFAAGRRVRGDERSMSRLYVVESTPTHAGAVADHRLPLRPSQVERFARAVAARLGVLPEGAETAFQDKFPARWLDAVVDDLQSHRGACLVLAGRHQPAAVHVLAHAINDALGSAGRTVDYLPAVEEEPIEQGASMQELANDLADGAVDLLLIVGGNPVYTAPADLEFSKRIRNAKLAVHLGLHDDETSNLCHWHVPQSHYLESWSDLRCFDGTASIVQPLIAPLYGGKSVHELLAAALGEATTDAQQPVRATWETAYVGDDFAGYWQQAIHDGVVPDTAFEPLDIPLALSDEALLPSWEAAGGGAAGDAAVGDGLELLVLPDPAIWDGRYTNNGWLQELPKPFTKLTWDNAVLLSPATAAALGVATEDVVEISVAERTVRGPVFVLPGQPAGVATVHLGYGRERVGRVGNGIGFNAYPLRTTAAPWAMTGARLRPTGERYPLATTQTHWSLEGRDHVRQVTLAEYAEDSGVVHAHAHHGDGPLASLYPEVKYEGYAWGMAIDLTSCNGCNACVVACQAENNIPLVGKTGVSQGREMHWLRIDRYYEGDPDSAELQTLHQPMLCQHCEKAPCEVVCPVAATTHSSEGLNEMTYNRCIGTRYCSNNCPYKVRRFNFLQYSDEDTPVLKLLRNPEVTVRTRGVMEKCTYCVQRISAARIATRIETVDRGQERTIQDGEVMTACQAACPAQAIAFGDINDAKSVVARWKHEPLNYGVLEELGTQPRTTYLARLRNAHPLLAQHEAAHNAALPTNREHES